MSHMPYEVFISFKRNALNGRGVTRDSKIAADLHKALRRAGVEAFFSERDISSFDFRRQIDDALDEAFILIAVGTCREHMESENVRYEWTSFHNDILSGIKPGAQIFSYIEGMSSRDLPRALRHYESFTTSERDRLIAMVRKILAKSAPAPAPQSVSLQNAKIGDVIPFGQYPQGEDGEVEPLMWRVLDLRNGKGLLITEKIIEAVPYNRADVSVTWEVCTLREWMNEDFPAAAFSDGESARIETATIPNLDSFLFSRKTCASTQDRVFALSEEEAETYFRNNSDRMAAPTAYAKWEGVWTSEDFSVPSGEITGCWWLRSPGNFSTNAAMVLNDGSISRRGCDVEDNHIGIRPALWVNLR